ncbi:hypothetical protein HN682_10135 [Candidatus Peregrinibacteria bacterium]|jgi:hypothetical protein|nr:hypothetical protein [Candidatus Peregrinibacteria bacterium]
MAVKSRYRIISEGGVGKGTKIIDIETGVELKNVAKIELSPIVPDDQITAKITLNLIEVDLVSYCDKEKEFVWEGKPVLKPQFYKEGKRSTE